MDAVVIEDASPGESLGRAVRLRQSKSVFSAIERSGSRMHHSDKIKLTRARAYASSNDSGSSQTQCCPAPLAMKTLLVLAEHPELPEAVRGGINSEQFRVLH